VGTESAACRDVIHEEKAEAALKQATKLIRLMTEAVLLTASLILRKRRRQ
jgi:hypothetical protein